MEQSHLTFHRTISFALLFLLFFTSQLFAQQEEEAVSEEIITNVIKPGKIEATQERINQLQVPDGFTITKFAEGLGNPRMVITGNNGAVYVSRREQGDALLLRDTNNDGSANEVDTLITKKGAHGIAIHENKFYLVTVKEVYSANLNDDDTVGELELLIDDLPDGGQHPNRTIAFGPDDKMYISIGSTCNACNETNEENATILQANPDGSDRKVFAKGLRNTIGFDWHPQTQELYGMDHGIDLLGDDESMEELNQIIEGQDYGWPAIYEDGKQNKIVDPDSLTYEELAAKAKKPLRMHTAHSSPLGFVFYNSDMFPDEFHGDAFVTFRGSWNRNPPSGYKISRVHFENHLPAEFEDFITGFLVDDESQFARVTGIAVHPDGSLLFADDSNGIIYRVAYEE
ncbi:MAG: PQQ-dependent sugar dehydrogenase [Balneolaceae bacterium]